MIEWEEQQTEVREMKVVDMHCDTIAEIYKRRQSGEECNLRKNQLHIDLEKMKAGDYGLQNFALFTALDRVDNPFEHAMKLADLFYEEMEANSDLIGAVKSYEDIEANWKAGRMSALMTIEEGGVCKGELAFLRDFYRMGVRMMTLTWNFPNELGYPNMKSPDSGHSGDPETIDAEHGLTEKGIEFLAEMERLGIIIDVSHLNDAGIWDVFKYTKKPFVASHSNTRGVVPGCPRNLSDEMLRELAERGGVAGINYYIGFLHNEKDWKEGETRRSLISDMILHMKHMKKIGGIGCIGLGSDFDGIGGVLDLSSAADLPLLEDGMRKAGFTSSEIEAVFHGNVLRVYKEILR